MIEAPSSLSHPMHRIGQTFRICQSRFVSSAHFPRPVLPNVFQNPHISLYARRSAWRPFQYVPKYRTLLNSACTETTLGSLTPLRRIIRSHMINGMTLSGANVLELREAAEYDLSAS